MKLLKTFLVITLGKYIFNKLYIIANTTCLSNNGN